MSADDPEHLRVEALDAENAELRAESVARRAEVRTLVAELPLATSRRALVRGMLRDVRHHPDKSGAMRRAARKLGRAPRKAVRTIRRRTA